MIKQPASQRQGRLSARLRRPGADRRRCALGNRWWRVERPRSDAALPFVVGDLPEIVEEEIDGEPMPVSSFAAGDDQRPHLPAGRHGRLDVRRQAGQTITCVVAASELGSPLNGPLWKSAIRPASWWRKAPATASRCKTAVRRAGERPVCSADLRRCFWRLAALRLSPDRHRRPVDRPCLSPRWTSRQPSQAGSDWPGDSRRNRSIFSCPTPSQGLLRSRWPSPANRPTQSCST